MTMCKSSDFVLLFLISFHLVLVVSSRLCYAADQKDRQVYIAYMGSLPQDEDATSYVPHSHHVELLQLVLEGSSAQESLVRSYGRSFNGFAAKLTEKEKHKLAGMKGVVSVFRSQNLSLQTTRSWDFIGFPAAAASSSSSLKSRQTTSRESDIIIGVLDSGIWPENPSFNDAGLPPIPPKWKGTCTSKFPCNKKVIGARTYVPDTTDARDNQGHGSHTASTAAGRIIPNTSLYGLANGTARGGVPLARLAAYKVCGSTCSEDGILAAFDDAIADGVDVISISLGSASVRPLDEDVIAIGALHAVQKGVFTSHSAGNSGSMPETTGSVAPWVMSVAASITDRRIVDRVVLGNGKSLVGSSINSFENKMKLPVVVTCNGELAKGKIAVCDGASSGGFDPLMGAVGLITDLSHESDFSQVAPLPTVELHLEDYNQVLHYINSTKNPIASILKSESITNNTAPVVVSFSSRGPNPLWKDILKPDISAPGVEILAGFSPNISITNIPLDKRYVNYTILSGTSMSCPHVTGAAVYVKSLNPDFSPSAIKSALMTTAKPMSPVHNADAEFAYGSGQLNPIRAADPGLVYETPMSDYINLLCFSGFDTGTIRIITGDKTATCSKKIMNFSPRDVNYPTIAVIVDPKDKFNISFNRTVTNVGPAKSTYTVKTSMADKNIIVEVEPKSLVFGEVKERLSFVVKVSSKGGGWSGKRVSGEVVWSDGQREVRSPIVVLMTVF